MTDTEARVAKAIFEVDRDFHDPPLPERHFKVAIAQYQARARAAIAAMPKPGADSAELVKRLRADRLPECSFDDGKTWELDAVGVAETFAEAASLIEAQAGRIEKLEEALRGVIADGDNEDMDAESAWQSMYDTARAALGEKT